MVKKMLMGSMVNSVIKELSPEIPEGAQSEVENEISNKLGKILGNNWAALPVSGPYMMVAVLVMNYMLLPMGITPVKVADKILTKSKEYEIDTKFSDLLHSAKGTAHATGEFTTDKIRELTDYSEEQSEKIKPKLREVFDSGQQLGKSIFRKGKSAGKGIIGAITDRFDDDTEKLPEKLEDTETSEEI